MQINNQNEIEVGKKIFKSNFLLDIDEMPNIRIKKIVLSNFKSIKHGEISFYPDNSFDINDPTSNIIGLYGQNGSGKTSVIDALSILKYTMSSKSVPKYYSSCIDKNTEYSTLSFTFDLVYKNSKKEEIDYIFSIKKIKDIKENGEVTKKSFIIDRFYWEDFIDENSVIDEKIVIFNEVIKVAEYKDNKKGKKQVIFDTSYEDVPFGPKVKFKEFIKNDKKFLMELAGEKRLSFEKSQSFLFSEKITDYYQSIREKNNLSCSIIEALNCYAGVYLIVIDSQSLLRNRYMGQILFWPLGLFPIGFLESTLPNFKDEKLNKELDLFFSDYFRSVLDSVSLIIEQIIPGLKLKFQIKLVEEVKNIKLSCVRDGVEMPLDYESDGIKKLVSFIYSYIIAYGNSSVMLAIDEVDSGIFEYLLGELFEIFQEKGKGQLIFTSHNLRPLEVLDKDSIIFTTANPENRFCSLKGSFKNRTLREAYFREIVLGEQDETFYTKTKSFKIADAMRNIGNIKYE